MKSIRYLYIVLVLVTNACDDSANDDFLVEDEHLSINHLELSLRENPVNGELICNLSDITNSTDKHFSLLYQLPELAMSLDSKTGELRVSDFKKFDFEANNKIAASILTIINKKIDTVKVEISLVNEDDSVFINDSEFSIIEHPNNDQFIGYLVGGGECETIYFSLANLSVASSMYVESNTGRLFVKNGSLFNHSEREKITATAIISNGYHSASSNITVNINLPEANSGKLLAYYPFSGNANDVTGNNYHGTNHFATLTKDRFGNDNSAYSFSKSGSFIDLGDLNIFAGNDNSFTFSFWMYPINSTSNSTILSKLSQVVHCGEDHQEFIIRIKDGYIAPVYYGNSQQTYRSYKGATFIELNKWYYVTLYYDGSKDTNNGKDRLEIYVNGHLETLSIYQSQGGVPTAIENTNSRLAIGNRINSKGEICIDVPFLGKIDELKIYKGKINLK